MTKESEAVKETKSTLKRGNAVALTNGAPITVDVELTGVYALLQHAPTAEEVASWPGGPEHGASQSRRAVSTEKRTARELAAIRVYMHDGHIVHPSSAVVKAMRVAGKNHKLKGVAARSVSNFIAGAVVPIEEYWQLVDPETGEAPHWEADMRRAVNGAKKVAICATRPRFDRWMLRGSILVDPMTLPIDLVHTVLEDAGRRVGLGSFRAELGGPFGRFRITKFAEQSLVQAA